MKYTLGLLTISFEAFSKGCLYIVSWGRTLYHLQALKLAFPSMGVFNVELFSHNPFYHPRSRSLHQVHDLVEFVSYWVTISDLIQISGYYFWNNLGVAQFLN